MNAQPLLPPIPQPPHDPTSWLLNGQAGWRDSKLERIVKIPPGQALTLEFSAESAPSLTDGNGSFGGLTVPANVALGPDGSIYLLDHTTLELKRFDPCECLFKTGRGNCSTRTASRSMPAIYTFVTVAITE